MDKQQLKELVIRQTDQDRETIFAIGRKIYQNPETGYKEYKTTETLASALENLGLHVDRNIAVTGCRAYANEGKDGPKIAVMGELDSVICRDHPDCDPKTGAMHACGHNIQTSVMYGVASALIRSGVLEQLNGKVDFMAVPAEEYIELDDRESLKQEGKLKYFAGKPELVYRGAFDDVDMCMMVHNFPIAQDGWKLASKNTGTGFIGKKIRFIGQQSHAGAAPWEGINALNMASIAINSMHVQRETFRDIDHVRVHQIITKGGDIVNAVPSDVRMETCVRAMNLPALLDANNKVNRCVRGAAIAVGGRAEIEDSPGQMPLKADDHMAEIFAENAQQFYEKEKILNCLDSTASFDMGDLSLIMPVLHGITSGISGGLHSKDYRIIEDEDAYITPVKILACTVIDLLWDHAQKAKTVQEKFEPTMTKQEYLQCLSKLEQTFQYK